MLKVACSYYGVYWNFEVRSDNRQGVDPDLYYLVKR